MNKLVKDLADKARFVSTPVFPDQDIIFTRFCHNVLIEVIGRIYRQFPESLEAEKLVDSIVMDYGIADLTEP